MPGSPYDQDRKALDEAFRRTGVPRSEFEVTRWGKDQYGKSHPTEWSVRGGLNKGAEVNIDDPGLAASQLGPKVPHIGYQTAGKRRRTGSLSGHILVQRVHVARGRASEG
ncbi:polymorphic toxin type 47 domain-containing protein [Pseudomonas sichuanensis]|uniref:polymorphic toxin type 47 domain-containing protein n=1 Tax=Pseudomonas sichuanensis TaxID=2213015 RepID=UPI002160B367|nr:polymorphic toxin type 47 domain-containing protein [Pseudomonas sichuanensis]UVL91967.1 polymorphic toxin type 47 domain-containing protein [Pseudomonas sichuanensis]